MAKTGVMGKFMIWSFPLTLQIYIKKMDFRHAAQNSHIPILCANSSFSVRNANICIFSEIYKMISDI